MDSISADIDLLARLAARGGTLSDYDIELLTRCSLRLSQLNPMLSASIAAAAPQTSLAVRPAVRPKAKKPATSPKLPVAAV
ncbi:MAG: hypothetical protein HKP56_09990 [Anderseniella sp.]|nr:hypothetical protein [Anderseniella sp.]